MTATPPATSITDLTDAEKALVLQTLLELHPELREPSEQSAADAVSDVQRDRIAATVVERYLGQSFMEIGNRAGRQAGRGYIHEADAQWELLEEALEPFVDEVDRLARIGHTAAAGRQAAGVLDGLVRLREVAGEETLIGWGDVDEHTYQLASWVRGRAGKVGVELAWPEVWDGC